MKVFVARQPIFNRNGETVAYELLYRNNEINIFPNIDGDEATADVIINSYLNIGLESLSAGKPCFINFTENLLELRVPTYFNPREIVVEILEKVIPSPEILSVCVELKELGYKIALDDFVMNESDPNYFKLMKLADYVKVDFLHTTETERGNLQTLSGLLGYQLLAEKVETPEQYEEALRNGYHFFQGYFFSKPKIIATSDVPTYFHSYYSIIQSLEMTEPSIEVISQLIEQDLSLSYKLLKLINSPSYRPKHKIHSIRQAIVLLGLLEIKRWIYVLAVRERIGKKKKLENEVITLCLTRAKMCELLAMKYKRPSMKSSFFLTGMFSLMETILSMPIEVILNDLPLNDDICQALTGSSNDLKDILDLVMAFEQADWTLIERKLEELNLSKSDVVESYQASCEWTEGLLHHEVEEMS
ncbi:HDOD domain-containing protein [Bacillus sp. RO3]|nr:HDOD domain-containing protein [Bacillus sp. RO3]